MKIDETPKPNSNGNIKANHFLINVKNQVGQYIVLNISKNRLEELLTYAIGDSNMFKVHISPTPIDSIWQLDNNRSNENAAYLTGDNYPWEALDNIQRRSRERTTRSNDGILERLWEDPGIITAQPIASAFYERLKKRKFQRNPLTDLISKLTNTTSHIELEIEKNGDYSIRVPIREGEYLTYTTTDELLKSNPEKCFFIEKER